MWGATIGRFKDVIKVRHFNPRAPCGARPKIVAFYGLNDEFQSTRPVWGATIAGWFFLLNPEPISIHAPRVGRDRRYDMYGLHRHHFNPRAPCGARLPPALVGCLADLFQSTRPVWGATSSAMPSTRTMMISIHAPRVGRDDTHHTAVSHRTNFNPRAPCGARQFLHSGEQMIL